MVSGIIAGRLEELSEVAKSDDHIALREALGLRSEYPRNPAVWAELARRYLAVDEYEQGMRTACTAIALALDTGMNSVAVAMFEEFAEHREHLVLAGRRRARLAEALRACGRGSAADWLMSRPDMFASQARL
jgi:hypothetical protein